jgi:hypothetical protein
LRRARILPQAGEKLAQLRGILRRDRTDFHAQAAAGIGMAHDRFGSDRSFLNEKVETQQLALALPRTGLKEKTGRAEIADAGNIG